MLLMIDAGNTRIKWAAALPQAAAGQFAASGAVEHAASAQLEARWRALTPAVSQVLIANVAGAAVQNALLALLARALPHCRPQCFASVPELAGVHNAYRDPGQLGCDRFAAAIGAHALFPGEALIVANCGTATTVDALDPDGTFLGGLILPGLDLMARALSTGTAQLPQIAWNRAGSPAGRFPDNTDDAILGGCLAAQSGAIGQALARHGARHGAAVRCVLSGGAAPAIAAALSIANQIVDNLVLTGLQAVLRSPTPRPLPE